MVFEFCVSIKCSEIFSQDSCVLSIADLNDGMTVVKYADQEFDLDVMLIVKCKIL